MKNEKNLQNKCKKQKHNRYQPNASCNVTALSNGFGCLGVDVSPDELYLRANSSGYVKWSKKLGSWIESYIKRDKLNQVWAVLEKLADEYLGHENGGTFKDNWLTFEDIVSAIDNDCPVLIGGKFTHGGHIVCVTGYNSLGFIVDDSWGNWSTGYKDKNGDNCLYHYDKIRKVMTGKNGKFRALVLSKG